MEHAVSKQKSLHDNDTNLSGFTGAGLSDQHEHLCAVHETSKLVLVLPDRQKASALKQLIESRRVRKACNNMRLITLTLWESIKRPTKVN